MAAATLQPGMRLGPYEIAEFLGAGGMSEVYRARDVRLDRTVAIKILPAHVAADFGRRERFTREARLLSTLNHPHIRALYDIGYHDGLEFLVMEYLDGETLDARLARRPLPVAQAAIYAGQVARALDAAHRLGIAHRDVKPANIMLVGSGVKLLDFGIARLTGSRAGLNAPPDATTITASASIQGTTQYMAPEQLEGHEGDPRSDIFSLGVTLYEMLSGQRPFDGPTRARVFAAILDHDPPPPSTLNRAVPAALERAVMRCLVKDPDGRWQSARDLASELEWAGQTSGGPAGVGDLTRNQRLGWLAAGVSIVAIAVALAAYRPGIPSTSAAPDAGVVRFVANPPQGSSITVAPGAFTVSPDGRHIAFIAASGSGTRPLWLRSLDGADPRPLRGTEDAWNPFWSPDSRSIAFYAGGQLKKVDVSSNVVQTIADFPNGLTGFGAWSTSGDIVFITDNGILRVPAAGGAPEVMARTHDDVRYSGPEFLPDGRHLLYHRRGSSPEESGIFVRTLDSPEERRILDSDSQAHYTEPGQLVFVKTGGLFAQPFDPVGLQVTGGRRPIIDSVSVVAGINRGAFSISRGNVLAYRGGVEASELAWFDRAGRKLSSLAPVGPFTNPALSSDATRVAVTRFDPSLGSSDIWMFDANGPPRPFTAGPSVEDFAVWSPDDRRIFFMSNRDGAPGLYTKEADEGSPDYDEQLLSGPGNKMPLQWTRDGRFLLYLFVETGRGFLGARWRVRPTTGSQATFPLEHQSPLREEGQGEISPDGRWLAYVADVTGSPQVVVRPFPSGTGRWVVSTAGGWEPKWRGDGRELFYLAPDQMLMSSELAPGPLFKPTMPRPLFRTALIGSYLGSPYPNGRVRNEYAVAPDGQRFLVNNPADGAAAYSVRLVVNWQQLIGR